VLRPMAQPFLYIGVLVCVFVGCSRSSGPIPATTPEPVGTASASAPVASAPPAPGLVQPVAVSRAEPTAPERAVERHPAAVVHALFHAPAGQSPHVPDDQRAGKPTDRDLDAFSLHAYRSQDADAPALEAVGTTRQAAKRLALADQPLVVQTAPGALVAFHAAALGTFASGHNGIVVRSDDTGIARVWFRTGQDAGAYEIMAVSPARSGLVVFNVDVE
jgi:hypothetical protein